jgi:hypothetical protein
MSAIQMGKSLLGGMLVIAALGVASGQELTTRFYPKGTCDYSMGVFGEGYIDGGIETVLRRHGTNDAGWFGL